jgi:hypothetical protein
MCVRRRVSVRSAAVAEDPVRAPVAAWLTRRRFVHGTFKTVVEAVVRLIVAVLRDLAPRPPRRHHTGSIRTVVRPASLPDDHQLRHIGPPLCRPAMPGLCAFRRALPTSTGREERRFRSRSSLSCRVSPSGNRQHRWRSLGRWHLGSIERRHPSALQHLSMATVKHPGLRLGNGFNHVRGFHSVVIVIGGSAGASVHR